MDFERARFNMVEQQIRPWDVLDFRLLDVLQELPREEFVSEEQKAYAYADMHLTLPNQSKMLEPKIVARMVQALDLQETDSVLEIGTGGGYATAVLAKMANKVTSIDIDKEQSARAAASLGKVGIDNVAFEVRDGFDETAYGNETYDAVYIGASVSQIPEVLCQRLKAGWRLVTVLGSSPVKRAVLITREKDGNFSRKVLFDTDIPGLIEGKNSLTTDAFVF
ncbi:MAG: protein-L-isoaspartate O-methyltransferase [Neisseriaceae bacterium]|nr:protein-L-isoaspartate O-methyltransferase [Neisseriaceae bacterium]